MIHTNYNLTIDCAPSYSSINEIKQCIMCFLYPFFHFTDSFYECKLLLRLSIISIFNKDTPSYRNYSVDVVERSNWFNLGVFNLYFYCNPLRKNVLKSATTLSPKYRQFWKIFFSKIKAYKVFDFYCTWRRPKQYWNS